MIDLNLLSMVILAHFVGDFIFQTDVMAGNKSKKTFWLWAHILAYSTSLMVFGPAYALVNAVLHFWVDFFTSRGTSKLYAMGRRHDFFVLIGFDQALHMLILIWTMYLIW